MFQIKDFASIAASMLNHLRGTTNQVTDFEPGSVVRSLVEAPAVEIDELYQQMFNGLKEAIPVALYRSLSFDALPALPARGLVRVNITSNTSDVLIPAGTVFTVTGGAQSYASTADTTIGAGQTFVDVAVAARIAGTSGNLNAGASFTLVPALSTMLSVQNLAAFTPGVDAESDADRKSRFRAYIATLARGTVAAIVVGLQTATVTDASGNQIERVASATLIEPWLTDPTQPTALVRCYIHNGVGNTSSSLVARALQVVTGYRDSNGTPVPGWKAAGAKVEILVATEIVANVSGTLVAQAGVDHAQLAVQVTQTIYGYLLGLQIGQSALVAEIVALAMAVDGVADIAIMTPTANITATAQQKLMPGAITFTP